MMKIKPSLLIDRLGILLSFSCGIHCASSLIFLLLGAVEIHLFIENEIMESILTILVFILGMVSFLPQAITRRQYLLLLLFIAGFSLLKVSENMTLWIRLPMLASGVLLIISAHYRNLRLKAQHSCRQKPNPLHSQIS
ncbi:MAG: MerC domain-containing protein [Cyclobacteriaceae bacterium]